MKLTILAVGLLSLLSNGAMASDRISGPAGEWSFGGQLSQFTFDKDIATQEGVSDSAWALSVDANYIQDDWLTTLSLEFLSYSDEHKFNQVVEGEGWVNDGDISTESSDAVAIITSVAFGKLWRIGQAQDIIFSAQAGYSAVVSSERSISYCSDCYSEDIDISGGAFVRGGIRKNYESVAVGLQATQYIGDKGLKNNIALTVHMAF